jgi:hypothetical protein
MRYLVAIASSVVAFFSPLKIAGQQRVDFGTIACGQVVNQTVQIGEIHVFHFDAVRDARITLTLFPYFNQLMTYNVLYPNRQLLGPSRRTSRDDITIPEDGQYSVEVEDFGRNEARSYWLGFQRIFPLQPNPPQEGQCPDHQEQLSCEQLPFPMSVDRADHHIFNFAGTLGEVVSITVIDRTTIAQLVLFDVFDPDGQPVPGASGRANRKDLTLEKAGNYTVRVYDANFDSNENYWLGFKRLFPADKKCLQQQLSSCSEMIEGTVAIADHHLFAFDGTAGQRVVLDLQPSRNQIMLYDVLDPSGDTLGSGAHSGRTEISLPQPGRYLIRVYDALWNEDRNYTLSAILPDSGSERLPGDCNADCVLNVTDAICIFGFLFLGDPQQLPCGNGEADDEGNLNLLDWQRDGESGYRVLNITDGINLLSFLFLGGLQHPLGRSRIDIPGCP